MTFALRSSAEAKATSSGCSHNTQLFTMTSFLVDRVAYLSMLCISPSAVSLVAIININSYSGFRNLSIRDEYRLRRSRLEIEQKAGYIWISFLSILEPKHV